jgi:hypothetical protein
MAARYEKYNARKTTPRSRLTTPIRRSMWTGSPFYGSGSTR